MRHILLASTFLVMLGAPLRFAWSNSETPLNYDARAVAMGGTGAAYVDNGAASVHNPALLVHVRNSTLTGTFTPFALKLRAPFKFGAGARDIDSGIVFGPFAHAGFATRLSKRFVIGAAAFLTSAAGGTFDKIPLAAIDDTGKTPVFILGNASVALFAGELQVPLAFQATPWLALAIAYRVTYAHAFAHIENLAGGTLSDVALSGTHFKGYVASAAVRPFERLTLGFVLRGRVAQDLSGKMTSVTNKQGPVPLVRAHGYQSPYQIRVGSSYDFIKRPLRLALDGRLWLYHELDKNLRNAYSIALGAEYHLRRAWALRAGYSIGQQATRLRNARAFLPPPGLGHAVSAGAGVHLQRVDIDAAAGFVINHARVNARTAASQNNPAGTFYARGLIASISGTYHY